jgi:NAD(P)-dependent dehydrogenase (short-subunit alcohol dehydrogenase family)
MREGGGGSVCIFTSRHAREIFAPDMLGYGGGKAFLESGIQRLAQFVGRENTSENIIRIFGFCPGWVQTENQLSRFTNDKFESAKAEQLIRVDARRGYSAPRRFPLFKPGWLVYRTDISM